MGTRDRHWRLSPGRGWTSRRIAGHGNLSQPSCSTDVVRKCVAARAKDGCRSVVWCMGSGRAIAMAWTLRCRMGSSTGGHEGEGVKGSQCSVWRDGSRSPARAKTGSSAQLEAYCEWVRVQPLAPLSRKVSRSRAEVFKAVPVEADSRRMDEARRQRSLVSVSRGTKRVRPEFWRMHEPAHQGPAARAPHVRSH